MPAPTSPLVSVALSMRNAEATICPAICSLIRQSLTDWELIVLDDGSADRSVELVRGFEDRRIRMWVDGMQLGLAARLNQAIDLARGCYLARMDADDVAYPDRLARQIACLKARPDLDLIGSSMVVFKGEGEAVGVYPARTTHTEICAQPFAGFYLPHPTWVGRLQWFKRWRYDPVCRKAQDQDLLLRAFSTSRFAALAEPLVGYRQDALSLRKSILGRYYFSRGILRVSRRDGRLAAGLLAIARQFAKLGVDALAIATGQAHALLRRRTVPFDPFQERAWREAWAACHAASPPEQTS